MNFNTPQNPDLYTRYMSNRFDEAEFIDVSTAWMVFFGDPAAGNSQTRFSPDRNADDIDIRKANNKYAKMRLRGVGTQNIGSIIKGLREEQFTTISRTYPLMEDFGSIGADQLTSRGFGKTGYMDTSKQGELRELAMREYNEIIRRFVRGFNLLCKQSILTGEQDAIFGTTNSGLKYDFYRSINNFYSALVAWDQTNTTIMADIDLMCKRVHRNSNLIPDGVFVANDAINAMIKDLTLSALADNRRFNFVGIGSSSKVGDNAVTTMPARLQKFVDSGWIYRGWIETPQGYNLNIFSTPGFVEEDNGDIIDMMPDGTALICNTSARCDRMFGPDEKLPMTPTRQRMYEELLGIGVGQSLPANIKNKGALIRPDMFYFDGWANENWSNVQLRCQSAPIFPTVHTDAFGVLSDLTTPE